MLKINAHQRETISTGLRVPTLLIFLTVAACSEPVELGPPKKSLQATVSTKISLKEFSTGQMVSAELRKASSQPFTWAYFAEPRIVKYETLADGTVVEIEFDLKDSWEGYRLREEMEKKFKGDGSPAFSFHCVSEGGSVDFTDKRFAITDEKCYAFDDKQTLVISRRRPKYEEPLLKQHPSLNFLVDRGSVTLYDQNLQSVKSNAELSRLQEKIVEDDKKAAADM